jgi:hypothetical protein
MRADLSFGVGLGVAVMFVAACTMDFGGFRFGSEFGTGGSGATAGGGNDGGGGFTLSGGGGTGNAGGMGGAPNGGGGIGGVPNGGGGSGGVLNGGGGMGGGGMGGGGGGGMGGMGGTPVVNVLCDDAQSLCNTAGDAKCCLPQGMGAPMCIPSGMCGNNTTRVECDEPSDCPGQICCGTFSMGDYQVLQCQNSCNGGGQIIVCDNNGDCSGNDTCGQSGLLPTGYQICN